MKFSSRFDVLMAISTKFYPDDGGTKFLQSFGTYHKTYKTSPPRISFLISIISCLSLTLRYSVGFVLGKHSANFTKQTVIHLLSTDQ